jgi:hypothetical protein
MESQSASGQMLLISMRLHPAHNDPAKTTNVPPGFTPQVSIHRLTAVIPACIKGISAYLGVSDNLDMASANVAQDGKDSI